MRLHNRDVWLSVFLLSIATIGFYSAHPGFWPLPNMLLGKTAAAASIGLINSFGNLGRLHWTLRDRPSSAIASVVSKPALLFLALCSVASGLLILLVRPALRAARTRDDS